MMGDLGGMLYGISIWALPLIFAVTLHEAAHGYAARAMGDDTAQRVRMPEAHVRTASCLRWQ